MPNKGRKLKSAARKRPKLTKAKEDEYVKAGGCRCPFCGSENIQAGVDYPEGREFYNRVGCDDCARQWFDIFTLTGVEEIAD